MWKSAGVLANEWVNPQAVQCQCSWYCPGTAYICMIIFTSKHCIYIPFCSLWESSWLLLYPWSLSDGSPCFSPERGIIIPFLTCLVYVNLRSLCRLIDLVKLPPYWGNKAQNGKILQGFNCVRKFPPLRSSLGKVQLLPHLHLPLHAALWSGWPTGD